MEKFKSFLLIILSFIIIGLFYLIFTGQFCKCSTVTCPNNDALRSVLT